MLDASSSLLERIAAGEPFAEIMNAVVGAAEADVAGAIGAVLLRDDEDHWRLGAAPHLPAGYARAVDGTVAVDVSLDESGGDIASDRRWAGHRSLARAHGFSGLWAHPLRTRTGEPLGTLLLCFRDERRLSTAEREAVAKSAALAGLALERQRREETRRGAGAERWQLLAEATCDAVWEWNATTDRVRWDGGLERNFGVVPADADRTLASRFERVDPAEREGIERSFQEFFQSSDVTWESGYRFLRADGRGVDVVEHVRLVRDEQGRAVRLVGGIKDVSARTHAQAQERRVQRMESIKSVAGGIAHDLNNLLAPILMGVELLKQNPLEERVAKMVSVIERSAQRGAGLVRQVRSFARGIDGNRSPVDLSVVLQDVATAIRASLPPNVAFETRIAEELWTVHGDAANLRQMFMNLCVNARDALVGGGKLTVTADNRTVERRTLPAHAHVSPGRFVAIAVSDTGIGISRATIDRIFEPFFTTKEHVKGAGLGLPTVVGILETHGGYITVQSELGRGSEFVVSLPAEASPAIDESEMPAARPVHCNQGGTVLLVDDETAILSLAAQALEAAGYRVKVAEHGAEAVSLFMTGRAEISVAVIDLLMPVMDGPTTIAALREIDSALKVIAASGHDEERAMARARAAGVTEFLLKPYTTEALVTHVQRAFAG